MYTNKEYEYLELISRFGYLDAELLGLYFDVSIQNVHKIVRKLVHKKYLRVDKKTLAGLSNKNLFLLSALGNEIFNTVAPKIKINSYQHDMLVGRVLINLYKKNKDLSPRFETEREIRSRLGFGTKEHIPDGILYVIREGKKLAVALEVEVTKKQKQKLIKNLDFYYTNSKYSLVWYYCNDLTINWVKKNNRYEKIKSLPLDSIVNYES